MVFPASPAIVLVPTASMTRSSIDGDTETTTKTRFDGGDKFETVTIECPKSTTILQMKNGKLHGSVYDTPRGCDRHPAVIFREKGTTRGRLEWFIDGQFARPGDRPTLIETECSYIIREMWHNEDGQLHREGGPAERTFDQNGNVKSETYYRDGKLHREDGPTVIQYDVDRNVELEEYYLDGMYQNRGDLPNVICYNKNGTPCMEEWKTSPGQCHRDNGPAQRFYDEVGRLVKSVYIRDSKVHREDGPAIVDYENDGKTRESWYLDGVYQDRGDLPNEIVCNAGGIYNCMLWYNEDGQLHRENGPASQSFYPDGRIRFEEWHLNGVLTRADGPAITWWYPNGNVESEQVFLDGVRCCIDGHPSLVSYFENIPNCVQKQEWIEDDAYFRDGGHPVIVRFDIDGNQVYANNGN